MRRDFPERVKKAARKRADGKCEGCGQPTGAHNPAEVHHVLGDAEGGEPVLSNAQVLGRKCCHDKITALQAGRRSKADRQGRSHRGEKPKPKHRLPTKPKREIMPRDDEDRIRKIRARHEAHLEKMRNK